MIKVSEEQHGVATFCIHIDQWFHEVVQFLLRVYRL